MELFVVIGIMFFCGLLGGIVNYLLPANEYEESGKKIKPIGHCLILGISATLIVPLFLKAAQSDLVDQLTASSDTTVRAKPMGFTSTTLSTDSTSVDSIPLANESPNINGDGNDGKQTKGMPPSYGGYFLYAAYCLLAAAAGGQFITDNVNKLVKQENKQLKGKNIQLTKRNEKLDAQNRLHAIEDEKRALNEVISSEHGVTFMMPALGPILHADDPQKERFGGLSKRNDRELKANVSKSSLPGFYNVSIWVESLSPQKPLTTEVIIYLHNSFTPSIYTIKPIEFIDGKAKDEIIAYGAFTVGAITDNGQTLLELDLAQQIEFPKEFRER